MGREGSNEGLSSRFSKYFVEEVEIHIIKKHQEQQMVYKESPRISRNFIYVLNIFYKLLCLQILKVDSTRRTIFYAIPRE